MNEPLNDASFFHAGCALRAAGCAGMGEAFSAGEPRVARGGEAVGVGVALRVCLASLGGGVGGGLIPSGTGMRPGEPAVKVRVRVRVRVKGEG